MCIEYVLALMMSIAFNIVCVVVLIKLGKAEDENEQLMEWCCNQEYTISDQEMQIECLEMELAKKESLICILRLEIEDYALKIEEKENKK